MSNGCSSQAATLADKGRRLPIRLVMRPFRQMLRMTYALEALGFFTFAFFLLRQPKQVIAATYPHLGQYSILGLFWFSVVLALLSAIAAWRLDQADPLGRWSLLAASIFNLLLFPMGTMVAVGGIFYFVRNPTIDQTPDRKHQPVAGDGTSKWSGAVFMIAQLVWGVFILSSIRRWTVARGMPQIHSEALFWITLASAVYGNTLFHELGHFVLGDIIRFRLIGFGVGPLSWAYAGGRWRSRLHYDKLLGGHTAMVPTTPRDIRARVIILTLGGPLASALLGAIGAICLILIPGPAWPAALGRAVALTTGFAWGDFIFNLLPMASEAQYSDGALLWQMFWRGPWCDFHCANNYMALSRTTPLRPRDWPTAMVERAAEFAARLPDRGTSFAMAYAHFHDRGDWQRALHWLEKAQAATRPGTKLAHALTVDRAFLEAFYRHNPTEAHRWLRQAPSNKDSADYWRSIAAVHAAQNDLAAADDAWNKASKIAASYPAAGLYDMVREELQTVHAWLEQLRAQPVSA